jgi:hypothetical protein
MSFLANVDPTTVGMLVTAITSMGTAVAYLHNRLLAQMSSVNEEWKSQMEEVKDALQDCQADREQLFLILAKQAGTEVSELRKIKE